jgi:RNA polymerase sigma factor (sigma-70 family)
MLSSASSDFIARIRRLVLRADVMGLADRQLLERFVRNGDEDAFGALVRRHGPMVFGVCRRFLTAPQDAEDAFQATFLVLIRRAGSISRRDLLGNWLYGVARCTALRAHADVARRHARERQGAEHVAVETDRDPIWRDLGPVLDDELRRLPKKYRMPVILCYLEGLTFTEAARQLSWPAGTVSGRLARAREILRRRLTRRGVTLSSAALGSALAETGRAAVPAALLSSTLRVAMTVAAKHAAGGAAVSAPVALLTEGVLKAMFLTKLKIATAIVAVSIAGAGISLYPALRAQPPAPARANVGKSTPLPPQPVDPLIAAQQEPPMEEPPVRKYIFKSSDGLPEISEKTLDTLLSNPRIAARTKDLLKAQYETASGVAHARWRAFKEGRGELSFLLDSFRRLTDAEHDLSNERAAHLAALEHQLARMRETEKINEEWFRDGRIPIQDVWEPRHERIRTELALERLKAR